MYKLEESTQWQVDKERVPSSWQIHPPLVLGLENRVLAERQPPRALSRTPLYSTQADHLCLCPLNLWSPQKCNELSKNWISPGGNVYQ